MEGVSARGSFDNPRTLQVFLGLRMIVLALVVGAGIMIMQLSQDVVSVAPLYVLLVASYGVGGLFFVAVRMGLNLQFALWMLMIADIMLEGAIVHFSGGVASQFSLIYCLSIIAAAFLLQVHGGLGIALLASVIYVLYGFMEAREVLVPPAPAAVAERTGSPPFLQAYMHVSLFFVVGAVSGYLAERTKRKQDQLRDAETELKQLRVDTKSILNNMSSGVLVIDSGGTILTINPTAEQILGVDKQDILSLDLETVFATMMPELGEELSAALSSDLGKERHEITIDRPGQKPLPLGISISRLRDEDSHNRGIIAVFQDLTEVRDMQERVRKADRLAAVGELSAGIAHELRNPLASISGSIEMLSNELEVDGENKRLMELIMKESDRLDRIISDFLEFARLRPPSKNDVSVVECVDEIMTLLKNNAAFNCNIELRLNHGKDDVLVHFDEEQLKQVFLNLAINACEAMAGEGKVEIGSELRRDGSLVVAFLDRGEGVSDEALSRLFEPFFTTKEGGTGLGLAMANKILEAHGGRIEVSNREKGGAEVAVVFPGETLVKRTAHSDELSSVR